MVRISKMLGVLFVLLMLPGVCFGWGTFPGQMDSVSTGVTPPTCDTGTVDQSQQVTDSSFSGAGLAFGQSFIVSSTGSVYSVSATISGDNNSSTIECRIGTSADLTTYLDTDSASITWTSTANVKHEAVFSNHPSLTAGTTYYMGCVVSDSGHSFMRYAADGNQYADGDYYYGSSGWSMAQYTTRDLVFEVSLCD